MESRHAVIASPVRKRLGGDRSLNLYQLSSNKHNQNNQNDLGRYEKIFHNQYGIIPERTSGEEASY